MTSISAPRATNTASVQLAATSNVSNPNAILSRYQPTGASATTARQDGLRAGVAASQQMARNDLPKLQRYAGDFAAVAQKYDLPPALLAAIASRESRGGSALDRNGRGDGGNGFGLMQVDFRYHRPAGGPFSRQHIDQAAAILKDYQGQVARNHPSWTPEQQLRGAVAAYNSGVSNVRTLAGMDRGTTGNDYSADVWARAQALAPHFGGASGTTRPPADTSKLPPFDGTYTAAPSLAKVANNGRLHIGHKGESVKELQKLLGLPAAEQDGVFGPKTRAAVHAFQQQHGLKPRAGEEGMVGPMTLEWLKAGGKPAAPAPAPVPGANDGFDNGSPRWIAAPSLEQVRTQGAVLKQGMQGPAVAELQKLLGLEADGKFGPQTKAAVESFQKSSGLRPEPGFEGVVGKTTFEAIQKSGGVSGADGISAQGRAQMEALLNMAERNSAGKRPDGRCLWHVNNWLDRSTYGKIGNGNSPRLPLARNYGDWLNQNYQSRGLKKLNIDNPYKAPPGAIVVVRPGTPGTRHPDAGDIVVVGRNGRMFNGGEMGYGGPQNFPPGNRHVIGIFVPQ